MKKNFNVGGKTLSKEQEKKLREVTGFGKLSDEQVFMKKFELKFTDKDGTLDPLELFEQSQKQMRKKINNFLMNNMIAIGFRGKGTKFFHNSINTHAVRRGGKDKFDPVRYYYPNEENKEVPYIIGITYENFVQIRREEGKLILVIGDREEAEKLALIKQDEDKGI